MDLHKRVPPQGSPRGSPVAMRRRDMEGDENVRAWSQSPRRVVAERAASPPQRKKVLGERNSGGDGRRGAASPPPSRVKPAMSPPSLSGCGAGTYDPKTNYTTPRPDFLRYNPEKRREILLRLETEVEDESSSSTSELVSSGSSAQVSDTESDGVDEEEEIPANRGEWARRLFLLLIAVACSCCYIYCMNSSPSPSSEMGLHFVEPNGSVHNSQGLRAPIEMMNSDLVLKESTRQIVHRDNENAVQLYGHRGSPKDFMAIAAMGLAGVCPNVPFGEFTCQIGDRSIENVQKSKEEYPLWEQAPEIIVVHFENAEQSREVASQGGNVIGDSIGSTRTDDMEEGKSEIAHQEEMEDLSYHSPQLASLEKALEPENEVLDNGEGLEIYKLDQGTEPLEYENTAEAAKAFGAMVKFLSSSMKLHLKEMLACLSVAGAVFALLRYFQRTPMSVPVSQHAPPASPAQVPILAPIPAAKLPVYHSSQSVQLPLFRSQQPVQLTVPKEDPPVNLEVPVQLPLPKQEPHVCLKVPVQLPLHKPETFVNLNNPVQFPLPKQKIQQEDADNAKASDGYTLAHREIDSSRPPVVKLLGEFSFVDDGSSSARSRKGSNEHGGNVPVEEPSVSLKKDVTKMQKESRVIKSPSAQRTRKEENAIKVEAADATPTPLRRSNRLLNRVTSP